jgi:hypothetical protein
MAEHTSSGTHASTARLAAGLFIALAAQGASFAQSYPTKPVRVVVAKAGADPAFQEKILLPQGMERAAPSGEPPEAFALFLQRDRALYERLKTEARLKLD